MNFFKRRTQLRPVVNDPPPAVSSNGDALAFSHTLDALKVSRRHIDRFAPND